MTQTEMIEVVEQLNQKYITDELMGMGVAFAYINTTYLQLITFNDSSWLYSDDDDGRSYDDDKDEYTQTVFDYCCDEYENMIGLLYAKMKQGD